MQAIELILALPLTGELAGDPAGLLQRLMDHWLPTFFRPMECHAVVSGEAFDWAPSADAASGDALWPGEVAGNWPVTKLDAGAALTSSVLVALPAGSRYAVRLVGGLRFFEPEFSAEPEWYGRVSLADDTGRPVKFLVLSHVQFHWNQYWREIRLSFPVLGYPLSGQLPRVDQEGMPAGTQSAAIVERNRDLIVEAFACGAAAIGFRPDEVSWSVEAEDDTPAAAREAVAALLQRTVGRA